MSYSLRRVLAVRFSLTMLVALALIALWALVGVQHTLRESTDRELLSTLHLEAAVLATGSAVPPSAEPADLHVFMHETNRFVATRDAAGIIVHTNISAARGLPLDADALAGARAGRTGWATTLWRDTWIRSAYSPAPPGSPPGVAVLQVSAGLDPVADANQRMLFVLFGTVVLGVLATAFGAFWLARSAVSPVIAVAEQAAAIAPESHGKRITVHADVAEYESLIGVLNDLLERCEVAFNTQRRFVGDVGHELRTPLASLQGSIEVALRNERSPRDYQLVLRGALQEVEHLGRMSESLLLITRAEGQTLDLHRAGTDLNGITRDLVDQMHRRIEEKGLEVTVALDYAGEHPALDEELVTRALRELLDNAVRLTPVGGRVALGTRRLNGGVGWWIEDSGPGIPADDLPRLFEPFYRVDPARTRDSGTGLGLTLAASFARLHGGTIRAENLPAGGARFEVEFPAPNS